ncbi:MAG: VWA domain-containing protein [Bacteroidota bacterium]
MSDSLGLPLKFHKPTAGAKAQVETGPTFLYMHRKISGTLELHKYSELAFLVDISGSMVAEKVVCMDDTRFAVMKDLSRKMVKEFPDSMALGIGTIGGDCPDEPAKWKTAGTMTKKELDTDLRFLIPDGTTPMLTRLKKTPELFVDSLDTPKTLFLISDGANTCREAGLDVCAFAEELARKGITINVLTFLSSSYNNTSAFSEYICLADVTGGRIIYMDNLRCNFQAFNFDLAATCQLKIPILEKSYCWGKHIKTLWMYSGE